MSLHIASLNSGSNGNCYYIANDKDAILVDAGICCRETEKRMSRLGLSMSKVRAIFVSHEHSDHIKGIPVIAKKYQLPVYITQATLIGGRLELDRHLIKSFKAHEAILIGQIAVIAFPKLHDASEPHSFIISCNEVKVGVFTDIGFPCDHVIHYFKQCHAAFLESNYDDEMLENGSYPYHLKSRIRGGKGHLSNKQALELFRSGRPSYMSHLLLSHLSKDNNSPALVMELFKRFASGTEIVLASRDKETAIYYISNAQEVFPVRPAVTAEYIQYSLFQ